MEGVWRSCFPFLALFSMFSCTEGKKFGGEREKTACELFVEDLCAMGCYEEMGGWVADWTRDIYCPCASGKELPPSYSWTNPLTGAGPFYLDADDVASLCTRFLAEIRVPTEEEILLCSGAREDLAKGGCSSQNLDWPDLTQSLWGFWEY